MNIFGIGGMELLLILLIMLIVAGPKRMLQWTYLAGRVFGQLRAMWSQMMENVQQELDSAGVDFKVPKQLSRNEINRAARQAFKPFEDEYRKAEQEYKQEIKSLDASIKTDGAVKTAAPGDKASDNGGETAGKANGSGTAIPPTNTTGFGTWSGTPTTDKSDDES